MMAELPPVYIEFKAKFDQLQSVMKSIESELKNVGKTSAQTADDVKNMGTTMVAVGTAVGNALTTMTKKMFGFIETSVNKLSEVTGEVKKLQRVAGGSVEDISRLRAAAASMGIDAGGLSRMMRALSMHLTANDRAVKALGFSFRDSRGNILPMNQVLGNIADKFKQMPDGAEKTAMAMRLFGRQGQDMLPILNQGSAGLQQMYDKADKLGLSLSGKDAAAIKEYTMAQKELHEAITALQMAIGRRLMPVMVKFADVIKKQVIPMVVAFSRGLSGKGGMTDSASRAEQSAYNLGKTIIGLLKVLWNFREVLIAIGSTMTAMWAYQRAVAAAATIMKVVASLIELFKALRAVVLGVTIAEAFATGGASVIPGIAGAAAATAAFGLAMYGANKAAGALDKTMKDIKMPDMPKMPEPSKAGAFSFTDPMGLDKAKQKDPVAEYIQWLRDKVSLNSSRFDEVRSRMTNMTLGQQKELVGSYLGASRALVAKANAEEIATRNTKNHHNAVAALNAALKAQVKVQNEMNRVNKDAADIAARQNMLLTSSRDLSYLAFAAQAENLTYVHQPSVTVPVNIDGREVFRAVQKQALLNGRRNTQNGLALSGSVV